MSGLLSKSQQLNLQKVVITGMDVPVEIMRRHVADDAYADDNTVTYTSLGFEKAWVRHLPSGVLDVVGAIVGNVSPLRLLFPIGTDIRNADHLVFTTETGDQETFIVQDTNLESTYKTCLWVEARHLD